MATGDPVPGAELYLEYGALREPIAKGETDAKGEFGLTLKKPGRYSVRVELDPTRARSLAAIDVQARAPGVAEAEALGVDYNPARKSSVSMQLNIEAKTDLKLLVRELQSRPAAAASLRAGLLAREIQLSDASAKLNGLIDALAVHFGAPALVEPQPVRLTWPPPQDQGVVATFTIATPDGLLVLQITARAWVDEGRLRVGVGGMQATTPRSVIKLAADLATAIFQALETLAAPPMGVDILLQSAKATGSKGGFAVGGFSSL